MLILGTTIAYRPIFSEFSSCPYLVVIGSGTAPLTIERLDAASGWALVWSERPEIDGGWINLGQAMMIRSDPR